MSGQTVPLTVKELGSTYGILFTGYVMAMQAYGFTFFQTYVYYSQYPLDHWVIKTMVGSLCLLDTINSALLSHALYCYLILSYPYAPPFEDIIPTFCAEIGVSALVIFIVQIYYSHHVWIASQNAAVAVGIAVISLIAFALGIAATGNIAKNLLLSSFANQPIKGLMVSSQGLAFVSGAATFTALSFYNPPNPMVESLFDIAVGYALVRGCLAATIQLGYFIMFILLPTRPFWMPFHLVITRVFINSLLTMLNTRVVHQRQGVNGEDIGSSRKTDTTSSSSTPHLHSNIRFAVVESKSGIIQVS